MANQVLVTTIVNLVPPFSGIACDVYGNQCQYLGTGSTLPHIFNLPSQFDTAPAMQLTIIDSYGCLFSEIIYCSPEADFGKSKQFQTFDYFFFMDGDQYDFQ